jgi:hypothetical protein
MRESKEGKEKGKKTNQINTHTNKKKTEPKE